MSTLVRWEPFRDIAQMQSEMSRLVERPLRERQPHAAGVGARARRLGDRDRRRLRVRPPGLAEDEISIEVA